MLPKCPATREAVAEFSGNPGCPLCGKPADAHPPEPECRCSAFGQVFSAHAPGCPFGEWLKPTPEELEAAEVEAIAGA